MFFRAVARHCIERFSPLGFQATRQYLASLVGVTDARWTAEQLVEALDMLTQERQRFLTFDAAWVERRRLFKKSGQRSIGRDEQAERDSMVWLSWPRGMIRNRAYRPTTPPTFAQLRGQNLRRLVTDPTADLQPRADRRGAQRTFTASGIDGALPLHTAPRRLRAPATSPAVVGLGGIVGSSLRCRFGR